MRGKCLNAEGSVDESDAELRGVNSVNSMVAPNVSELCLGTVVRSAQTQSAEGRLAEMQRPSDELQIGKSRNEKSGRKPIPAKTRHHLILKYNGQCAHVDAHGLRCRERRFLEVHHIRRASDGGSDDPMNLILYCSGHHRAWHHRPGP